MREIKFRAWHCNKMYDVNTLGIKEDGINKSMSFAHKSFQSKEMEEDCVMFNETTEFMQYTGLKDENGKNNCIYEEDIVSLRGNIIGNKYETPELLKDATNLLIEGFGTKTWRITEEEAMARGCHYSE